MDSSHQNSRELQFQQLSKRLSGELKWDTLHLALYATDASVYREMPSAVALPSSTQDLIELVNFSTNTGMALIPRATGTSLAGQVVGSGLVVDVSKHMDQIIELNVKESYVWVQPGVVRDALNLYLKPYGLFFGPNTSTANRATIGGMVGNNSCGSTSIVYGSTRDHVLALKTILSDGSEATFENVDDAKLTEKINQDHFEGQVYRSTIELLSQKTIKDHIREDYPKQDIKRRNTGYAIDALIEMKPIEPHGRSFNFCELLCGSEGTLALTTAIKLNLVPLPPSESVLLAVHFSDLIESLEATIIMMTHQPSACELMDKTVLDCTKNSPEYINHRFFIEGDPAAIILLEFRDDLIEEAKSKAEQLKVELIKKGMGYAYPILTDKNAESIWELRKAGLGLLSLMPGDEKAVACIEDTAVSLSDLPNYITQFSKLMAEFGQQAVYYAHAGAGELHLRPIVNLKTELGKKQFRAISSSSADLVKSFKGSLSGEHGDGRVRSEFIPKVLGDSNYRTLELIKSIWDPNGIFNPGKIVNPVKMDEHLRTDPKNAVPMESKIDFGGTNGMLRAAEACNGSGDCRKLQFAGGSMCPSYRVTRNEKDSTRGRANLLREFLTNSPKTNPLNHPEIREAMDLCIGCKACVKECPSAVDMTALKSEFLFQYHKSNKRSKRDLMIGSAHGLNTKIRPFAPLLNFIQNAPILNSLLKRLLGFHPQRSLPQLLRNKFSDWLKAYNQPKEKRQVYLFVDEFLEDYDFEIGKAAVELLNAIGFEVLYIPHKPSGRSQLSKGFLKKAKKMAEANVMIFSEVVNANCPLIGIEPSAILSFRDEYPKLVGESLKTKSKELSTSVFTIDEFLGNALNTGFLHSGLFRSGQHNIVLHGHCHQKALSKIDITQRILEVPIGNKVSMAPSGCCGMAGAFGYEKEHYKTSLKIGELAIFPHLRQLDTDVVVAATGISCRHQIKDALGRRALHPVVILRDALI